LPPPKLVCRLTTGDAFSSPAKRRTARLTRYLRQADVTLVFARPQERYLREEVGLDHVLLVAMTGIAAADGELRGRGGAGAAATARSAGQGDGEERGERDG